MFVWLLKPYIKPLVPAEISDTHDICCAVIVIQKQYTFNVKIWQLYKSYIDGLMQKRRNSSANALSYVTFAISHWYELSMMSRSLPIKTRYGSSLWVPNLTIFITFVIHMQYPILWDKMPFYFETQ